MLSDQATRLTEYQSALESQHAALVEAEQQLQRDREEVAEHQTEASAAEKLAEEKLRQAISQVESQLEELTEERRKLEQSQTEFRYLLRNIIPPHLNSFVARSTSTQVVLHPTAGIFTIRMGTESTEDYVL